MMAYSYPAKLEPDADGRLVVHFPALPEALTDGADEAEALREAVDCLSRPQEFQSQYTRFCSGSVGPGQINGRSSDRVNCHRNPTGPILPRKFALYGVNQPRLSSGGAREIVVGERRAAQPRGAS